MDDIAPIHASAFVYEGMGCLVIGESGTGKSRVLIEAIAHGAHLIADDRVRLCWVSGNLVARPVPQLDGVLELRGLGLIRRSNVVHSHPIHLIIELDAVADERLPGLQTREYLGIQVPYLRLLPPPASSVMAMLLYLQAMQEGRILPTDWHPLG